MDFRDRTLVCKTCGKEFLYSASFQKKVAENNWSEPKNCSECNRERKGKRNFSSQPSKNDDLQRHLKHKNLPKFLNPYNFVRSLPYSQADFFSQRRPISHALYSELTGKIKCRLEVKTPLFVSSGEPEKVDENNHSYFKFFSLDGINPAIPGSSLRGMIRSIYETVTNSCYSILDAKKTLTRRMETSDAKKLVPARVVSNEDNEWKLNLLEGQSPPEKINWANLQKAAWIRVYEPLNNKPVQRDMVDLKKFKHGDKAWAVMKFVKYEKKNKNRATNIYFWNVIGLFSSKEAAEEYKNTQHNKHKLIVKPGWVCITGQNMENKHDEKFFFGEGKLVDLPQPVRDEYNLIIKDYRDRHAKTLKIDKEELPELSHFIRRGNELQPGDLVYAHLNDARQVEFIVPVQLSRRPYLNSIGDLLLEHLNPCTTYENLCPACRLFGWVKGEENKSHKEINSYAGRVEFSNGKVIVNKGAEPTVTLAELATPKPTTTFFYLKERNGKVDFIDKDGYNDRNHILRGRKLYRHFKNFSWITDRKTKRNRTIIGAVKPKSEFQFTVDYTNLTAEELGALLWSLQLEEGMYHRLGYGKPLGLGSVKVIVDSCIAYDIQSRYSGLSSTSEISLNISDYIDKFKGYTEKAFETDFNQLDNIQDLKAILSEPSSNLPIHYPKPLKLYDDGKGDENFKWFATAKKEKDFLPIASEDMGLTMYKAEK
ncbi:MAG: TIGR03986 family CRISPR-associated RAMP protein [Peptococcales bacterium]